MQRKALGCKNMNNAAKQQGLVLFVTLIALLILMLTSVALIRSTDANLQIAGNMAFKSDLRNQAERAIPKIQDVFKSGTGALYTIASREVDNAAANYYATIQASNDSGIPNILFGVDGSNANNILPTDGNGIEIRYVIDRMCLAVGPAKNQVCTLAGSDAIEGCNAGECEEVEKLFPVYRITLRAIGPRNTEVYMQTTFSD